MEMHDDINPAPIQPLLANDFMELADISIMYVIVLFLIASRAMRFISNEERRYRKAMQNEANRKGIVKIDDEIQRQIDNQN